MNNNNNNNKSVLKWTAITVSLLLAFALIGWVFFGYRVATSPIKGAGEAEMSANSADNRLAAQRKWASAYEEVLNADKNVDTTALDKESEVGKTRHMGAISYCNSVTADYNKLVDSPLTARYLPEDLPPKINTNNPETDCSPTLTSTR